MRAVRSLLRVALWAGVAVLVLLAARALAYALVPQPTPESLRLGRQLGGPGLVELTIVALGAAALLAAAVLGVATAAVRQRHLLAPNGSVRPPAPALGCVFARAVVLWLATGIAFAWFESHLHERAGLGEHGLHCLLGPVHRDALPLLAALSLFAAAFVAAAEHVIVWLRRTIALLREGSALRSPEPRTGVAPRLVGIAVAAFPGSPLGSRGPPRRLSH